MNDRGSEVAKQDCFVANVAPRNDNLGQAHVRRQVAAANLIRLQAAERVLARFHRERISAVLLKGAALHLTVYRHPGDRPMTDVDFWLPFDSLSRAAEVLRRLGYRPIQGNPGEFVHSRDPDDRLDLETRIWFVPDQDVQAMWRRTKEIHGMRVLCAEDAFLYCVAHGLVHHGQWEDRWSRDLALLCRQPKFDWSAVARRAQRWGIAEALSEILRRAIRLKGPSPDELDVSPFKQQMLLRLQGWQASGKGHILRFVFQPDWPSRTAFLLRQLFPDHEFLRRRYRFPAPVAFLIRPIFLGGSLFILLLGRLVNGLYQRSKPIDNKTQFR